MENVHTDVRVKRVKYHLFLKIEGFERFFALIIFFYCQNNICQERLHCHEPRGVSCLATGTEGQRKLLCSGSFDSTIAIRDCKVHFRCLTYTLNVWMTLTAVWTQMHLSRALL